MSGNSRSSCLQTAPIVSAFSLRGGASAPDFGAHRSSRYVSLYLPTWSSSPFCEAVRLDPAAVHVGAVQRAQVVDVEAVAAPHEQRVVARHGHVVEEHLGVRAAADRACARPSTGTPRPSARRPSGSRASRPRGSSRRGRPDGARRSRPPGRPRWCRPLRLGLVAEEGAALLAVVRALGVDEAALGAVHRYS